MSKKKRNQRIEAIESPVSEHDWVNEETQEPVSIETEKTVATETEETVSTEPQETVATETEEAVAAEPQETRAIETEETVAAEPQESEMAEGQEEVTAEAQEPETAEGQEAVTAEPQEPETAEAQTPVADSKSKKKAVKKKAAAVKTNAKTPQKEERLQGAKLVKELIRVTIFSVALGVFCFALTGLGVILWGYWSSEQEYKNLTGGDNVSIGTIAPTEPSEAETETAENGEVIPVKPDYNLFLPIAIRTDYFKTVNPDYRFYLHIPGTAVSYPVVLATDADHYLRYTFSGKENMAGAIAIDYRMKDETLLDDFYTVISGHNRQDGTMFSDLLQYYDEDFRDKNPYVYIVKDDKEYVYEVFACALMKPTSVAYSPGFAPYLYMDYLQKNTVYKKDYGVTEDDKILTMYTCNEDSSMRYLIHAVLRKVYDMPQ